MPCHTVNTSNSFPIEFLFIFEIRILLSDTHRWRSPEIKFPRLLGVPNLLKMNAEVAHCRDSPCAAVKTHNFALKSLDFLLRTRDAPTLFHGTHEARAQSLDAFCNRFMHSPICSPRHAPLMPIHVCLQRRLENLTR
jgi:hypothetical protein